LGNKKNLGLLDIDWENVENLDRFDGTELEQQLPRTESYFVYYYYAFLVLCFVLWYFIKTKIALDTFSLLMLIPSFVLVSLFIALNEVFNTFSYKFDMYNIIWYQVFFTILIAIYSLIVNKRKRVIVWIFSVVSSVSMVG